MEIRDRRDKANGIWSSSVDTSLGWVLSGPCDLLNRSVSTNFISSQHVLKIDCAPAEAISDRDVEMINSVRKFWEIEDIGVGNSNDTIEKFQSSVKFDGKHYSVELPWKYDHGSLPDNFTLAKARLSSLVRRLKQQPERLKEYDDTIKNQEAEGIVENVANHRTIAPENVHYIPHREVIREDRSTTKMRIVYDGSAKRKGRPSLNDCLETGPCMLPLILDIVIRFRWNKVALTSDIKSAFLNIRVAEKDRDYLRFLWISDIFQEEDFEIIIKRFTSVLFGLNSSPFLLMSTVKTHMMQYINVNMEFVLQFLRDLYMDDSVTGTQLTDTGFDLYLFIKTSMKEGSFDLRKWNSNDAGLLKRIRDYEKMYFKTDIVEESDCKVLGIKWNTNIDTLEFDIRTIIKNALGVEVITKRNVLGVVASFYDPMGILSPITVVLKILFSEVCVLKCDWDVKLPDDFVQKWKKALVSLLNVGVISISRYYFESYEIMDVGQICLHGFSDASGKAMAAVVYITAVLKNGHVIRNVVAGKTKITPTKQANNCEKKISMPKMELMACLLLSKLVKSVVESLEPTGT